MKTSSNFAFTLLLGAFLLVGLSACAEGDTGETVDTTEMGQDTMSQDTPPQNAGMQQDSVSLQSTNQLLQGGITSIAVNRAVQNIEGWEQKLGNLQAEGQVAEVVSNLTDGLGQLKEALQGGNMPNGEEVNQAFQQINQSMQSLMQNAESLQLQQQQTQQLQTLQQTLQQAAQQLGGGGM